MTAVEKIIAKYNKQWNKYGMGSVISYSQVIADLEQAKEMEREQIMDAFIFSKDPFGLSIGNSHTIEKAEDYYNTTFKSE